MRDQEGIGPAFALTLGGIRVASGRPSAGA